MSRIRATLAPHHLAGQPALICFLTVGYPALADTVPLAEAILRGGADLLELGIPFSDPLADGATIQRSSQVALRAGVTPDDAIACVRHLRTRGCQAPLLLMGYYNPILSYGPERFCDDLADAGGDGLIVPDLPPEEAGDVRRACHRRQMDLIFMLAPTSTDERIERVAREASGFIYCVSLAGVTGSRAQLSDSLPAFLQRVRQRTRLPLAVGFGISSRRQVEELAPLADGAVVGSALLDRLDSAPAGGNVEAVERFVRELAGAAAGR